MAYAQLAVTVVSAIVSTYAAYQQSEAQKAAAKYNERVSDQNADLAEIQAKSEAAAGEAQQEAYRRKLAGVLSTQRAGIASTGVDLGSGSALDLQESTAALGALDTLQLERETRNRVWQARLGGLSAQNQAGLYALQRRNTSTALATTGSFLSGASQVGQTWYQYGRQR